MGCVRRVWRTAGTAVPRLAIALALCGCSTPLMDRARRAYYTGDPQSGLNALEKASVPDRDRILFLMERGTLYQGLGRYAESARDFEEANALLEERDTLSISRGAGSMVVNDNVLRFYGYPFERTYLHVMASLNYLARGDWEGAGVEGRRIINSLKPGELGAFPEDAFSRYLAGLCMELVDDPSNAAVEYRKASRISARVDVTDMGWIYPTGRPAEEVGLPAVPMGRPQLVCMVFIGRVADYSARLPSPSGSPPTVDIYHEGRLLGRAYTLADLGRLAAVSESRLAAGKAARATARLAGKWAVSKEMARENETLGGLLWLALLMMEQPDYRHWETLPRYVNVGRVVCPPDADSVDLVVRSASGSVLGRTRIPGPIPGKGLLLVGFSRTF